VKDEKNFGNRILNWVTTRTRATQLALLVVLIYVLVAIFVNELAPYSPTANDSLHLLKPPSWQHLFGTDSFGRDVLSRVVAGTRTILGLAFVATAIATAIGSLIGLAAGYRGGIIDEIIMRVIDIFLALPSLLLALLLLTTMGSSPVTLVISVVIAFTPRSARILRSAVLPIRRLGYVEAARLRGERFFSIIISELLPNVREVVAVEFCLRLGYSVMVIASLGFLGLGVQPPTPDWGLMVGEGRNLLATGPWTVVFPAIAIGGLVVSINFLADGLWRERAYARVSQREQVTI
jgi:peptide/nickel transport system permease protein